MDEIKFTKVEAETVFRLVCDEIDKGCYIGNREQYYKRLDRIKSKILASQTKPKAQ